VQYVEKKFASYVRQRTERGATEEDDGSGNWQGVTSRCAAGMPPIFNVVLNGESCYETI
jgi:hypothetical protein